MLATLAFTSASVLKAPLALRGGMTIAGVELMKTGVKPRRIDLLCIAGHPRGRRGAGKTGKGEPHSPLCPPSACFICFISLAALP